jgi:hypothetical protein
MLLKASIHALRVYEDMTKVMKLFQIIYNSHVQLHSLHSAVVVEVETLTIDPIISFPLFYFLSSHPIIF